MNPDLTAPKVAVRSGSNNRRPKCIKQVREAEQMKIVMNGRKELNTGSLGHS